MLHTHETELAEIKAKEEKDKLGYTSSEKVTPAQPEGMTPEKELP